MPRVVNVDILDDRDPIILVQQYIFDDRTLLVFRKPSGEEGEQFTLTRGVEVDPSLNWSVDIILDATPEDAAPDEDVDEADFEVFALIYRAEDNPCGRRTTLNLALPPTPTSCTTPRWRSFVVRRPTETMTSWSGLRSRRSKRPSTSR